MLYTNSHILPRRVLVISVLSSKVISKISVFESNYEIPLILQPGWLDKDRWSRTH